MKHRYIYNLGTCAIACLALFCWQGCAATDSDDPQPATPADGRVAVDLALCVSGIQGNASVTRMASDVVQGQETPVFRGIQDIEDQNPAQMLTLIPLSEDNTVLQGTFKGLEAKNANTHYYYTNQLTELYIGTTRFLCYAKAPAGERTKAQNGSIVATLGDKSPANISFNLDPICPNQNASGYDVAQAMADYLNRIAKAPGFSTNEDYQALYRSFINQSEEGATSHIAGSTKNVKLWVKQLKDAVDMRSDTDVKPKIISAIDDIYTQIPSEEFPANLGLPDGAAAMKWITSAPDDASDDATYPKFVVVKGKDDNTSLSDHSRFTYPAELYYFANSRIKTSSRSQAEAYDRLSWAGEPGVEGVLQAYENDNATVASTTRSVAIKDTINYAVALLEAHITADATTNDAGKTVLKDNYSSLKDASDLLDHDIEFDATSFPLTGIMIGGQFPQHYDFTPLENGEGPEGGDPEEYILYDTQLPTGSDAIHLWTSDEEKAKSIQTLVFQTRDYKPIDIVLEFENNSGHDFIGYNGGTVYDGTKFYLTGQAWPSTVYGTAYKQQRVFTKDYKTVLNLTIKSLKNAYNVIPELRTATHSIRVSDVAVKEWTSHLYDEHDFYNW